MSAADLPKLVADNAAQIAELVRELRGHNGTPGLLTRFAVMEARMDTVIELLTTSKPIGGAVVKSADDGTVKKAEVAKVLWEIAKPIVTGGVLYFLFQLMPQLFGHLGP